MRGEGAGGSGHALAAFKYSPNTYKKGSRNAGSVVRAVGARGGPGTHWQPLKTF